MKNPTNTTKKEVTKTVNKPSSAIRLGNLCISEWQQENAEGEKYYVYTLQRSYKNKEGEWKNTNSYTIGDMYRLKDFLTSFLHYHTTEKIHWGGEASEEE